MRECRTCHEKKALTGKIYTRTKKGPGGWNIRCKECDQKMQKERVERRNREVRHHLLYVLNNTVAHCANSSL